MSSILDSLSRYVRDIFRPKPVHETKPVRSAFRFVHAIDSTTAVVQAEQVLFYRTCVRIVKCVNARCPHCLDTWQTIPVGKLDELTQPRGKPSTS